MTTSSCPASSFEFDPFSPAHSENPESSFGPLREQDPLHYWSTGAAWVLTRYQDVADLLKDPRFTMDQRAWKYYREREEMQIPDLIAIRDNHLFQLAPADHGRVRKLAAPSFPPSSIARLEGPIQGIVDHLLARARVDERQTFDVAAELAGPLPIRALGVILGIPEDKEDLFRRWGGSLLKIAFPFFGEDELREALQMIPVGCDLVRGLIEERSARPCDDLLSKLVSARDEGQRLSSEELLALVAALITAGSDSTAYLISYSLYNLLTHPDQLALVIADPQRIPDALEEVLRFDNFSRLGTFRFALEDVPLHGKVIEKGDMVVAALGGAMHDGSLWPDAERFDVCRDPARNISFGRGPHFCIGTSLARLEGTVAVRTMLERFPTMRLGGKPVIPPHPILRPMQSLEVTLR